MLQRIQSLYLLLAAGSAFGVLAAPFAVAKTAVSAAIFANDSVYNVQDNIVLLVLFAVAGALALASIFLYMNRVREMRTALATKRRVVLIALLANLAGLATAVVYLLQQVRFEQVTPSIGLLFPVLAMLFALLAMRNIRQDEKKVSSSDRLR